MNQMSPARPIRKLLIANRGEIALRVIRTAKELGINTVAVYADSDRHTLGCDLADETYPLHGASALDTYLNRKKLITIANLSRADAIHPGYGFLSEDASFATMVQMSGLKWVGPSGKAIATLGDKIAAKKLAATHGVHTIPGILGGLEGKSAAKTLLEFGQENGWPILVKRADGGGGRGIYRLEGEADAKQFLSDHDQDPSLKNCLVEKLLERARHLETQCGRDQLGNFQVYSTRDCTIQRRNQKVVEEAPAPFLSPEVEQQLHNWSRALFEAVDYQGLGTCEYLLTPTGKLYFLEVNPRLQVEHPVTEEVTGVDLVAQQLRIAMGEPLNTPVGVNGHAIELRITSEDPADDLMPKTGKVTQLRWPGGPGVRIDSYLRTGEEIGGQFDSLIGKIIVKAASRPEAIIRARRVLSECQIQGIATSMPLLDQILSEPDFAAPMGKDSFKIYTRWLEQSELLEQVKLNLQASGFWGSLAPDAPAGDQDADDQDEAADDSQMLTIEVAGKRMALKWPGELAAKKVQEVKEKHLQPLWRRRSHLQTDLQPQGEAGENPSSGSQSAAGESAPAACPDTAGGAESAPASSGNDSSNGEEVLAPIQASVVRVAATPGTVVKAKQLVMVLEAMKMEKYVHAPCPGTVSEVLVEPGQGVKKGQVLLRITPD